MKGENEKTSLKQMIQGLSGEGVEVLQGIVKSADPLKIQIINDEKLVIGPNITYVPVHLSDHESEITVDWATENRGGGSGDAAFAAHSHDISGRKRITIHNALKTGEKVHVLSFSHGKQYYVLGRVG